MTKKQAIALRRARKTLKGMDPEAYMNRVMERVMPKLMANEKVRRDSFAAALRDRRIY